MSPPIIAYIAALVVMGLLDGLWFSVAVKRIYRPAIGHLMVEKPNIPAALAFYLIYPIGVVYFAVLPVLAQGLIGQALVHGAILGFVAYATYDLTSLAIMRGWPARVSFIDLAWGTALTAVTSAVAVWIAR